jgi:AcrR family transcriptional regulator
VPDLNFSFLKFVPREGGYSRGQEIFEFILKTAVGVLVDHGYEQMTLRRIAQECGMKAGNISYYFKSKAELLAAILEIVGGSYDDAVAQVMGRAGSAPEKRFAELVTFILQDGTTRQTSYIFPELWSLANHDPLVKEHVDRLYMRELVRFAELIGEINPTLSESERDLMSKLIISSIEGIAVFAGYGKAWQSSMPGLQEMAYRNFLDLIKRR